MKVIPRRKEKIWLTQNYQSVYRGVDEDDEQDDDRKISKLVG
jgi:hypothetical protein